MKKRLDIKININKDLTRKQKIKGRIKWGLKALVTIILATLKLKGIITWSWWLITAPIWIPLGMCFIIAVSIMIGAIAISTMDCEVEEYEEYDEEEEIDEDDSEGDSEVLEG